MTDPSELATALSRAGIAEVDASTRRRAEYSSDASNYRVVPQVVVFPRHVDEALAALDVARSTGVSLTARGAGTSIAGNAVGAGVVLEDWKRDELEELPPMELTLPADGRHEGDVVPVRLRSQVTEVGTLLLEAEPLRPLKVDERWRVELSVRGET